MPDLHAGGAERIVTTLCNHLPDPLFETKLLLMRREGAYLDILDAKTEIIDIQTQRIRHAVVPMLKVIRKERPDIVFCGFGEVNAYLSMFIKLFPSVKFVARETNVVSKHVTRPEIRFFYRFYNNFHRIICQSRDMAEDLSTNFKISSEKITLIHNPVNFDFIRQQISEGENPYTDNNRKNVVAVGNLTHRKGFDNLLRVFHHLKDQPIHLHIVGSGRDEEALRQQATDLGLSQVTFHGQQKNPYRYLAHADLFILSSRYEGFPNVLLEAGACGTYSLANNCPGGINEIIQPGINGETASIEQHGEFAAKITQVLQEDHAAAEISESIRSRYALPIILQKYVDCLTTL